MKKIAIVSLLLVAALAYVGCKKKTIVEYDADYTTEFVVAAGTATPGVNYYWASFNTDIASQFAQRNLNSNNVGEITCRFFELKVKGPTGANMNVMKDYEFFLNAGDQKEVRMAYCSPWMAAIGTQTIMSSASIATTINPVQIKIEGEACKSEGVGLSDCTEKVYNKNLKNYFIEPTIRMKMKVYPHTTVPTTYTLTANFRVHVKGIE